MFPIIAVLGIVGIGVYAFKKYQEHHFFLSKRYYLETPFNENLPKIKHIHVNIILDDQIKYRFNDISSAESFFWDDYTEDDLKKYHKMVLDKINEIITYLKVDSVVKELDDFFEVNILANSTNEYFQIRSSMFKLYTFLMKISIDLPSTMIVKLNKMDKKLKSYVIND